MLAPCSSLPSSTVDPADKKITPNAQEWENSETSAQMEKTICSSSRSDTWIQRKRSPWRTRLFKMSFNKLTTAPPRPTSTSTKASSCQRANSLDLIHCEFLPSVVKHWLSIPVWVMEKALSKYKATKLTLKTLMIRIVTSRVVFSMARMKAAVLKIWLIQSVLLSAPKSVTWDHPAFWAQPTTSRAREFLLETGSFHAVLKRPILTVRSSTATKRTYYWPPIFNFLVGVATQMWVTKIITRATQATITATTLSDPAMTIVREASGQSTKGKSNTTTCSPNKSSEAILSTTIITLRMWLQVRSKPTAFRL